MGESKIRTEREREREAQRVYLYSRNATVTNQPTITFSKGYKVTLYSDSLRATGTESVSTC